jgi:alkaline phosphatase D
VGAVLSRAVCGMVNTGPVMGRPGVMNSFNRRQFVEAALALGATFAMAERAETRSHTHWQERRELYPEGVASGDPTSDSVLLWTRHPFAGRSSALLTVEVARDSKFKRVVSHATTTVHADSDWTCRVLVAGLSPAQEYWYRFSDEQGFGSRLGRTLTAPSDSDARPVRFAFVSCQNVNQGAQHAYRRMIFEDERAAAEERLGFVLHLGDFIYELVWYPEDRPQGMYDRRIRDIVRYANGQKITDFHIPTTLADYRAVYRAYLHDEDVQDARARWPFVNMWDNHEFSWLGWQGMQDFEGTTWPAQTRKVAANQAWFEYQPARIRKPGNAGLERFDPPSVSDVPVEHFDADGFGQETNNLAAVASLTGYRALRWGRHVDLIITDQHSYRSHDPTTRREAKAFSSNDFPEMMPQEIMEALDAGRTYGDGAPPATIRYGDAQLPNFAQHDPAQTILGRTQKAWFLQTLKVSTATWKIWGNTEGTLDFRADPQHLPPGLAARWPGAGYACFGGGDYGSAYLERAEIYDFVRSNGVTGFATVAGDRHSFWAGLAAKALPPQAFEPVGIAFVTGSISAPGLVEALEHNLPPAHPLRALYLADPSNSGDGKPQPTVNMLLRHGVRSCLEFARTGDAEKARRLSNPELSPHLSFLDMGGHGYAIVRASADSFESEFVCIPRPVERSDRPDGGPLLYRVLHKAQLWGPGEQPKLRQTVLEGDPQLSL